MSLAKLSQRIAQGHAREKHWPDKDVVPLAKAILDVMENFEHSYPIGDAARKIYQSRDGRTVIVDKFHRDGGTYFIPDSPKLYFKKFVRTYR
jgi:hypothetical protein